VLLSIALAVTLSSAPRPATQAQATVRITRAARVTKDEWTRERSVQRREVEILEGGRPLTIRLIEFE
jgi:hypothetical protein